GHTIVWTRSIAERALDLIWGKELAADRLLPAAWTDAWKHGGIKSWPEDHGRLPRKRGQQCFILRLITGTEDIQPLAKHVTKPTYLLVDHLQSVGDFGQHREEHPVTIGFAAAVCLSAIELCARLGQDFRRP